MTVADPTAQGGATLSDAIFAYLPGTWSLERQVPGFGSMTGTAEFSAQGAGVLHYRETVVVTSPDGARFDGVREYLYRLADGAIEISFADPHRSGDLYVRLAFSDTGGIVSAVGLHHCIDDVYEHRMTWADADRFTTEIAVRGPRKNYRLDSVYRRLEK